MRELAQLEHARLALRANRMTEREKTREPAALGFVAVHRKVLKVAASGVSDVIRAARDRSPAPSIVHIEDQRRIDADRRMQTRCRAPCAEAHTRDVFAVD